MKASMITVDEALARILALMEPVGSESVPLDEAAGRVLAAPFRARRDQPPFDASQMDGYALRHEEARPGARFRVIGEVPAGGRLARPVGPGEAVRIFTGAPVPAGADRVVMQEDVIREGDMIRLSDGLEESRFIRPRGSDFAVGEEVAPPRRLKPAEVALAAAMNVPRLTVRRRPRIAIIATGNELVWPGEEPGPAQIVASNGFAIKGIVEEEGAAATLLPIARDDPAALREVFASAEGFDLVLTIGGASVGDYDLVHEVASEMGLEASFYKVRIRPGKPLMAGRMGDTPMIGLPGNPVSSIVCTHVFIRPAIRALLGLPAGPLPRERALLAVDLPANGPREHYMRATLESGADGAVRVRPFSSQDSALLRLLAGADAFLVRPIGDPARSAGETVEIIRI